MNRSCPGGATSAVWSSMKSKKDAFVRFTSQRYDAVPPSSSASSTLRRGAAGCSVNAVMTTTYWAIGRPIVEPSSWARTMPASERSCSSGSLSIPAQARIGRGFSERNLDTMRRFFLTWSISQTASAELENTEVHGPRTVAKIHRCGSGRLPMIEVAKPKEARETLNRVRDVLVTRGRGPGRDEVSFHGLVEALGVVVRGEFGEQVSKGTFTEDDEVVEARDPNGLHEALRVCIVVRAARGDRATLGGIGFKEASPRVGEERIAIVGSETSHRAESRQSGRAGFVPLALSMRHLDRSASPQSVRLGTGAR